MKRSARHGTGPSVRTVVVGGGLAGLSAARELGREFVLLEAEDRLGGLCRTERVGGFSFDWTGHWLHARDPEMRELIARKWLAGNLLEVQRRALIYSEGVWTRFPYQFNLHGLPAQTIADCIIGFVRAAKEGELGNAADYILRHLGRGFAEHFMFPYNEKLYTVNCEELSPEWGGRFIPRPSLEEVVRGALGLAGEGAGYNATFWYPKSGGIEALAPSGCRSFAVEFAHRGAVDPALSIEQALRGLEECKLIDRRRLRLQRARTIPVAYVLFDHEHAKARAVVLAHLASFGVEVAGRYGRWEYSSMEDALLTGREAARNLS